MPAATDPTPSTHARQPLEGEALDLQLERLVEHLARREGNPPGELAALLPSEPVTGISVVACWRDGEDVAYEVVRLSDGTSVTEPASIREAFTLLAMAEELESALDSEGLEQLADMARGVFASGNGTAARSGPADDLASLQTALVGSLTKAEALLRRLAALAPDDGPRVASAVLLDRIGGELSALERTWEQLARAAQAWADVAHMREPERVQQLWTLLGAVHRGPLAVPPALLVQRGREAGKALCADVLAG